MIFKAGIDLLTGEVKGGGGRKDVRKNLTPDDGST